MSTTATEPDESGLLFAYGERPAEMSDREVKPKTLSRAKKLLQDYYDAKLMLDSTFPIWYTKGWEANKGRHPFLRRGLAMKEAFSHLEPAIRKGELIVMSRNKYVRGASLVPWTANTAILRDDERKQHDAGHASNAALEEVTILSEGGGVVAHDTDELISISKRYGLPREEYDALLETCRYWNNASVEETSYMWGEMHPEYQKLVNFKNAVLMSSDMEYGNRHGRSVNSFALLFTVGFEGMKERCREYIEKESHDGQNVDKVAFWLGTIATIEGVQVWIRKYAKKAAELAEAEADAAQKKEFEDISERLYWIAEKPPRNFMDAVQLHWSAHLEVYNEMQGSGFSPGRLGAVFYPYWKKDMDEGKITREQTLEVLECMRVKYTELEIATSTATTGILSGNTFNNICLGGQNPDGSAGDNELEYLFLEAAINCPTVSPDAHRAL